MKRKSNFSTIMLVLMLIVGLSLLLYPSFSDYWNSFTQSRAIVSYAEQLQNMDEDQFADLWAEAHAYNASLLERYNVFLLTEEQQAQYPTLLNIGNDGIMGYIEIPKIGVTLPLYHGTEDSVLSVAIGHIEWTSLPVGGESTHCVVSGHRGLPSAKLFTDLDELTEEDIFTLNVLGEILTYQVNQIKVVEPFDTSDLLVVEGEDYCTLVTCTPYGINSHRLLVRGTRIENAEEFSVKRATADAVRIQPILVAPLLAAPILLVLLVLVLWPKPKKYRKKDER